MIINETISDDPILELQRKARVKEFVWSPDNIKSIVLCVEVTFLKNGQVINDSRIKTYSVNLRALNSTLVNPVNGNSVEDGENAEDCTIGEYDYLCNIANGNINIFDIMKATIAKADARGRFNQ